MIKIQREVDRKTAELTYLAVDTVHFFDPQLDMKIFGDPMKGSYSTEIWGTSTAVGCALELMDKLREESGEKADEF